MLLSVSNLNLGLQEIGMFFVLFSSFLCCVYQAGLGPAEGRWGCWPRSGSSERRVPLVCSPTSSLSSKSEQTNKQTRRLLVITVVMTSAAGMGKYGSNGGREEREREKKGGLSRSQKIKKQEEREREGLRICIRCWRGILALIAVD